MAKKKPSGASVRESMLRKLEKQYDQLAGALHCANAQDGAIREQAIREHDKVQVQLARIAPQLRSQLPEPDRELAQEYSRLLKLRAELQESIWKVHTPAHKVGPTPPL